MNYNEGATRDGGKRKERPPSLTLSSQEHGGTQGASDHPRPSLGSINSHSSLDPYYFTATIARPVISSTPEPRPEPNIPPTSSYGDIEPAQEPKTPATHPGSIDRAGLVGVGDLTTPRWTSRTDASSRNHPWRSLDFDLVPPKEDSEPLAPQGAQEQDNDVDRSSPWTIEAVDESDTNEMPSYIVPSPPPVPPAMAPPSPAPKFTDPAGEFRALRARRSVEENPGEKSAGEEILYPRTVSKSRPGTEPSTPMVLSDAAKSSTSGRGHLSAREARRSPTLTSGGTPASSSTPHRHRKRPSEEISPSGSTGRANGSSSSSKDETSVRRHRSLGVAPPGGSPVIGREKAKERRRQDVANSMISPSRGHSSKDSISKERHVRRSSASAASTSSPPSQETTFNKRAHDFSHLPPSPSSTTLQHILKSTTVNHTGTPSPLPTHATVPSTSSVAHSLLRGTQEGWSGLDDSATAEALRKLDGISGKNLRARSSVISVASKSSSRPGTPGSKTGHGQWEGVEAPPLTKRRSVGANLRDATPASSSGQTTVAPTPAAVPIMPQEKEDADLDMTIIKASNTPIGMRSAGPSPVKRGSGGSTHTHFTSTGTPSSTRDYTSASTSTSVTSTHVSSHRHSSSGAKLKRSNSTGSDSSSIHSEKDRAAALAAGADGEPTSIPPVPPLPKAYQTPPGSAHQHSVNSYNGHFLQEDPADHLHGQPEVEAHALPKRLTPAAEVPQSPSASSSVTATRTPSKKWSFSGLNLRLPSSGPKEGGPLSPLSPRKSLSGRSASGPSPGTKQQPLPERISTSREQEPGSPSLVLRRSPSPRNSTSSHHGHQPHQFPNPHSQVAPSPTRRSTDRLSRPGSNSSHYTNATSTQTHSKETVQGSPTRRPSTTRRLTPSSIPFFRRSSTHSAHSPNLPSASIPLPPPPLMSPRSPASLNPTSPLMPIMNNGQGSFNDHSPTLPSLTRATPPTADITSSPGSSSHRKSMLMGLPSLLKGSNSRRSLHGGDKSDAEKKQREEKSREREREREEKAREKERRKEEKKEERSESRISVLMGRRRGKTLSSADATRKTKTADPELPPMQMPGIPSSTAQRVASLRASVTSGAHRITVPSTPPSKARTSVRSTASPSSPSQKTPTVLTKSSDVSLRSNRQQLPTIAGSPSVSTVGSKEGAALAAATNGTPSAKDVNSSTKIPRISSQTSAGGSPQPAMKSMMSGTKRGSVAEQSAPSEVSTSFEEFGLLDTPVNKATTTVGNNRYSVRGSPQSSKQQPRYAASTISSSVSTSSIRKPARDSSISLNAMRKSSTASVNSMSSSLASSSVNMAETPPHRFSALSPAKSIKMLSPKPKIAVQSPKAHGITSSPALRQGSSSSSDRHSFSTPSPIPTPVDEEELLGDEEMMDYIRRQHARKIASGAKKEDLEEMLKFPEPIAPAPALTPQAVLKSSQAVYLSDYERKEILDYPNVYFIGARSDKKPAMRDNPTNNYSYDDDRGDYQIVNGDHLAYRYEVIETLGKGSFGQVLHCRDHCTGESVAIKIIRNKKRFHHQALVEIKILDNLRKWDPDEKHHVIKMTENFYFRNHLCIAMELLSINLYELIKANGFVGFTTTLIRRFTTQMLGSLSLMRHHRIVHCDLKPENILLRHPAKSGIKVIDFGSSCLEHEKVYTYIQSRFYRSPEVILGMSYSMAIDMWSLGCILAELYTGFPIFPGENEQEQLACIMEVLGVPDKDIIQRSSRRRIFFDSSGAPRPVVNSKGRRRRPGTKTLSQVLRCDDADFVDFIAKCLIWDPDRRLKPQSAMRHPFITGGRGKSKTPTASTSSRSGLLGSSSTVSKISRLASSSSNTQSNEVTKKMIGPPTPLTATRTARLSAGLPPISNSASSSSLQSNASTQRAQRYLSAGAKLS